MNINDPNARSFHKVIDNRGQDNGRSSYVNVPSRGGLYNTAQLIQTTVQVHQVNGGAVIHFSGALLSPNGKLVEPYVSLTRAATERLIAELQAGLDATAVIQDTASIS